ncbi:MAG TPA: extracellular solute-binding protein, partial [Chloroflexota bacterium]|nr:extracellular solute-binding protein [Chloroflexota bacterium]
EGGYLTAGFGSVVVFNKAPHPNATKVYLDWLLSNEGQTDWSKATGYPSWRTDVSRDQLPAALIPQQGVTYEENYKEQYVKLSPEVDAFVKTSIGS